MSHPANIIYLEQQESLFDEFLQNDDFVACQQVIHDLLDKGFEPEAFHLAQLLQKSDLYHRYEVKPQII